VREGEGTPAHELFLDSVARGVAWLLGDGRGSLVGFAAGALIGVIVAVALPPRFTSTASFVAQGAAVVAIPSALQGLAASVGIGSTRDFSPQFYADLFRSHPVMLAALRHEYPAGNGGPPANYVALERIGGPTEPAREEAGLRHLTRRVAARADVRTNIVTVAATSRSPELSRDILVTLLRALDSLNIRFRQEQSRELRQFFEARVQDAQRELVDAEEAHRRFLERNRVIDDSPLLRFEDLRLRRAADLKQTVYVTVVRQYEEARLQESRNVPVLTVLSPPVLPTRKTWPPRRLIVLAFAALGFAIVPAIGAVREIASRVRRPRA